MMNIFIRKVIILINLISFPFFVHASGDDFLSESNIYNTFKRCSKEKELMCLDYLYNLEEEEKVVIVFRFEMPESLSSKGVEITSAIEKAMLMLIGLYNPTAAKIIGVSEGSNDYNFDIAPFSKESIIIGVSSIYNGDNYSGYFRLGNIHEELFVFDIQKTENSPIDLLLNTVPFQY